MKASLNILTTALAALLTLALAGCIHPRPPSAQERADRVVKHIVSALDLDADQQRQLQRIEQEFLAKGAELGSHRDETCDELITMLQSDTINPERFKIVVAEHEARAQQLIVFLGQKFREFHDLLTPEQRAKAAKMIAEFRDRHHRR